MCADHARAVPRRRPLGKPAPFPGRVRPALDHLAETVRIQDRQQRIDRSVGVPEAVVGVQHSLMHLTVIRAVVDGIAALVRFVPHPGKQLGAIVTGVECASLSVGCAVDLDPPESLLPGGFVAVAQRLEGTTTDLQIEVPFCLVDADERRRDAQSRLSTVGQIDRHTDLFGLTIPAVDVVAGVQTPAGYFGVDFGVDIAGESVGYSAAVAPGEALEAMPVDAEPRGAFDPLDQDSARTVGWELKAETGTPFGGRHGQARLVTAEKGLEQIRPDRRVAPPKHGGLAPGSEQPGSHLRHDEKVAVVSDPRAGLVRGAHTLQLPRRRLVEPRTFLRLWRPVSHAERRRNPGRGVACRESVYRIRALLRIHAIGQPAHHGIGYGRPRSGCPLTSMTGPSGSTPCSISTSQ